MGLSKDAKSARAYMDELDMLREKVLSFFSFKFVHLLYVTSIATMKIK